MIRTNNHRLRTGIRRQIQSFDRGQGVVREIDGCGAGHAQGVVISTSGVLLAHTTIGGRGHDEHVVTRITHQSVDTHAAGDGIATAGTDERVAVGRANDGKTLALVRQADVDTGPSGCGRNGRNATQFGIKRSVQVA